MLKSNKVNLVLALIVAIVLWSYVLVDVNQSSTETVKGVPITIINEDELEANDLVILSTDYQKVNITYSCQRTFSGKIKDSEFSVTADVEGLKKGSHKVKLFISAPDDVSVENINIPKITVTIDELVTVEKTVTPIIDNSDGDETEPNILQVSDDTVSVKGAKSLVDQVTTMNAVLDASKVETEMKSFTVPLVAVDAEGNEIENVQPSKKNVSLTAVLFNKKTVDLEVNVEGLESSDFQRSVSVPKTITIKGRDSILANIDKITCQTVNLEDVYDDTEIAITPILPSGVSLATDSESLCIKVSVKGVETNTFTFSENDVAISGISEDMAATVESVKIKVTVTALSDAIKEISAEDFLLSADVTGLEAGSHSVRLVCTCEKEYTDMEYTPEEINITINAEQ